MKLEELLPQLHNKITYFIYLNRTTPFTTLSITKTTNTKAIKPQVLLSLKGVCSLSLVGQKTTLFGTMIMNIIIEPKEIVEYKYDYIKFNKNRKFEDFYITQTKQGLVNAIKILFKKYNLPLPTYKYIITRIKNNE